MNAEHDKLAAEIYASLQDALPKRRPPLEAKAMNAEYEKAEVLATVDVVLPTKAVPEAAKPKRRVPPRRPLPLGTEASINGGGQTMTRLEKARAELDASLAALDAAVAKAEREDAPKRRPPPRSGNEPYYAALAEQREQRERRKGLGTCFREVVRGPIVFGGKAREALVEVPEGDRNWRPEGVRVWVKGE
jgi:hypothetical protein